MSANSEHDLTRLFPSLVAIGDLGEARMVREAAMQDGHEHMSPATHAILKAGKVIGCAALGNVPLAHVWMNGRELKPLETALVFHQCESELRRMGFKLVVVPTHAGAPLADKMEKHFGYAKLGDKILFGKRL